MKDLIKKISYQDLLFAFLSISLFMVFLMPFTHYTSLNLIDISSGGKTQYSNDLLTANISLFKDRYYIFYYTLCMSSIAIVLNFKLLKNLIGYFFSFSKTTQIAVCLFFVFGIISSVFAISPSIAFKGVSVTFLQFINVMFVAWYVQHKEDAVKNFYMVVMLSLVFFGGALALQLMLSNLSVYGAVIAGNIQKILLYMYNCLNPRFLDNYFSWFMPLLLLAWFVDLRPIYKVGSFIALTVVWFVLINHAFRTIFAEYFVILPLLLFFSRRYFKITVFILVTTFVCAYLVDLGFKEYLLAHVQSGIASSEDLMRMGDSGRSLVWAEAFRVGLEHPFTGIGQWNYLAVTKRPDGYPHNLLLEIWSQWGIPAFICATVVIVTCMKNLFTRAKELCANPYHCIFMMMLVAGMVDGMLNAMFKTSLGLFGCVFVFGLCLSMFKPQIDDNETVSVLSNIVVITTVLACLFCIVILPLIYPPMWM
ncbi:O-antigen ligase family protein [Francisellaceae bacterium CB52]